MRNCNKCFVRSCNVDYKKLSKEELSGDCPSYIKQPVFKMPMLVSIMSKEKNVAPLYSILERFGFSIDEIDKYPFFRLKLDK